MSYTITGVFLPLNKKNKNDRIYTIENIEQNLIDFSNKIKNEIVYGQFDPDSETDSSINLTHMINKIWIEGNKVMGEATILDTESGKIIKSLVDNGAEFVLRPRSLGYVDSEFYVHIKELITFDIIPLENDTWITSGEIRKRKLNRINKNQGIL